MKQTLARHDPNATQPTWQPEPPHSRQYQDEDLRDAAVFIFFFTLALLIIGTIYYWLFPITPTPGL